MQLLFSKVAVGKASDGEQQVNHQCQIFLEFSLTIQQLLIQIRGDHIPGALITALVPVPAHETNLTTKKPIKF